MSPTAAATAIAGRVRGRHSIAQNRTGSRYQGVSTPLPMSSIGATGSSTRATARRARSFTDSMWPTLAWNMNRAQHAATTTPASANARDASVSGR